jgi:oligogalacturonide lyase
MAKGDTYKSEFYAFRDSVTGREVVRLTPPEYISHQMYFYSKMFTNDSKKLIIGNKRTGKYHYYMLDLENGETRQLTEEDEMFSFGAHLTADDRSIILNHGPAMYVMDLKTLKEEKIHETPGEWAGMGVGFSDDYRTAIFTETLKADLLPPQKGWGGFSAQMKKKPLCRIVLFDMETGKRIVVYEEKVWMSHPQIRPGDPNTIMFCHEGPWDEVDARLWLINADGTNLRCAHPRTTPNEQMGHEYFLSDGSALAFVHFASKTYGENATVRFINPDTLEEKVLMPCSGYSHMYSNLDNTLIVGDGTKRTPENHVVAADSDNQWIYMIDVKKKKEERLCFHGTSEKTYDTNQDAHVHASFSPDSKKVVFTSDREGMPCVYLCTI